ncbi:fumarate hydratase [Symbiobacterium thermophilum]|uniref:Fumarate hydratase subunit A n=1 Tax=Symbiobacterium thermophilum (strain DSM 24528 / JCM 14929 / IAM 14863 / T) TaxID=292459 RepID=Q67L20_SYMTH|nr:fumarate hydratase [Symbiobacterium thermophilum]BAD41626.1 fumarate hydratase subunit A [Symbiobacterium thermophilum IAM 14863]
MRELHVDQVAEAVSNLVMEANYVLEPDVAAALEKARCDEQSAAGRAVLEQLVENADLARNERVPMCQDTGNALVFLEVGQDLHVVGGDLYEAVNRGVRKGYTDGYLRKSIVDDPLRRKNTGDNTPAFIYTDIVPGDRLRIRVATKGGGAENMGQLKMLPPSAGWEGAKRFIVEAVAAAGPNACPPVLVGVGIGGNFDKVALLAKKALLRPVGEPNPDPAWAAREQELLAEINKLGIGPMGLGGRVTAFAVHIETMPCHITALPVAVNIDCHAHRHKEVVL